MTMLNYPALPPAPRRWPWVVSLVLLALLQVLLWGWRQEQYRLYATTGLRFSEVLSEETVQGILEPEEEETLPSGISASFWGQQLDSVQGADGRKAENVVCIGYRGDARGCLPVRYQAGGAPGLLGKECALSAALAEALFGSTDVVGLSVTWQEQIYTVCGVFAATDCVLLAPSRDHLTAAELRGVSADAPKEDAEQWCQTVGLPTPQAIVYGPQRLWLADCLCWAPLWILGLGWLGCLFHLSLAWPGLLRWLFWFALALVFALLLPLLLQALPGWLVPARWSDISFWEQLWQKIGEGRRALAETPQLWRDYGRL